MPARQGPSDWARLPLVATALPGKQGFNDGDWIESPYISNSGIRLIQTGNIGVGVFLDKPENKKFITEHSFRVLGCKWVRPGDVLICRMAEPIGRACAVPDYVGNSVTAVDCTIYRPSPDKADAAYMLHHLNSASHLREAADIAGGSTRQRISRSNLGGMVVSLPPLPEQRRIAEILDTLDEAIRKTEQVIAKLQQMKQGLLHDLLTRGIDENGELRDPQRHPEHFKDSVLGRIPRKWEVRIFGELLDGIIDFRGRTPKKLGMSWGGGSIPALSAKNVRPGMIDLSQETYYGSSALYDRWMTSGDANQGDVLLTMEAPLGNVAQIPDGQRYILSQRVILLKFDQEAALDDFMAVLMRSSAFQDNLKRWSTGTTATGIQRAKLVQIRVPLPPPWEQQKIADRNHSANQILLREVSELEKLRALKQGLMDDLLTGRVRVAVPEGVTA